MATVMDHKTVIGQGYAPVSMSLANRVSQCQPITQLVGKRLSLQVAGSLQKGLADRYRNESSVSSDNAGVRSDFALMAAGLVRLHSRSGLSVANGGVFRRLCEREIEQAVSVLGMTPLLLCRSALEVITPVPASLVMDFFSKTLTDTNRSANEPGYLFSDLYNADLFADSLVTLSTLDRVAADIEGWQGQRMTADPDSVGEYLSRLESRLSESRSIAAVQRMLRKLDDAVPFWRLGQRLDQHYFTIKTTGCPGLAASLSVIGDHLFRCQNNSSFPWRIHNSV